jgi:hypothetical protein
MTRKEGAGLRTARKVWTMDDIRAKCDEVGECLLWKGAVDAYGYPRAHIDGRSQLLRPFIWREIQGKELRKGYRLSIRCGNRLCLGESCLVMRSYKIVAQLHGEAAKQNPLMVARFREGARKSGLSKLTADIAAEIRASGASDEDVALRYGICRSTAGRIRRGDIWAAPKVANSIFNLAASMGVGQ